MKFPPSCCARRLVPGLSVEVLFDEFGDRAHRRLVVGSNDHLSAVGSAQRHDHQCRAGVDRLAAVHRQGDGRTRVHGGFGDDRGGPGVQTDRRADGHGGAWHPGFLLMPATSATTNHNRLPIAKNTKMPPCGAFSVTSNARISAPVTAPRPSSTDPWQPAVLALVATTATAGARAGKPVGVCGEAAADPLLARVLAGLGVTSLSSAAAAVAGVGAKLATVTMQQCRDAAEAAGRAQGDAVAS